MPAIQVIDGHASYADDDPNHAAIGAPAGSFYTRHTGTHREVWIKINTGPGSWQRLV